MKRFLIFFVFVLSFLFLSHPVFAADYFSTSYYVTYDVQESGITHTSMKVTLTNKTKDYYASSYKVQVGFEHIENLTARDPDGLLTPKTTAVEGGTAIEAEFNKHVVGEGNALVYTISFDTPDIAKKDGEIWEINIPGLEDGNAFSSFTAEVKVPPSFGQPAYIKPKQETNATIFTKEQLGKSGISIAYGDRQIYGFNLFYHLKNSNLFPVRTEIALPPNTNYQDIYIEYMQPKPTNVTVDDDGNWLASYRLAPSQKLTIQTRGTAVVRLTPQKDPLTQKQIKSYITEQPNWEISNSEIQSLAKKLKTPQAIYDYLVKNFTYDYNRDFSSFLQQREGALKPLESKTGVCLEFTDAFIALARAAGIPAREVDGYANTENARQRPVALVTDILHAWPEYYDVDSQTWIMVDPTWGNTTGGVDYFNVLDFDHVAFVIRGLDSEYPIPAGGYKYQEDENLKDVNVSFPRFFTPPQESISVSIDSNKHYSLLPLKATLTVQNTGEGMVSSQKINISSDTLLPGRQTHQMEAIPPFGHSDTILSFQPVPVLTNDSFPLTITLAGLTLATSLTIAPLFLSVYALAGGIFIAVLTIVLLIVAKKTRRLPVS